MPEPSRAAEEEGIRSDILEQQTQQHRRFVDDIRRQLLELMHSDTSNEQGRQGR